MTGKGSDAINGEPSYLEAQYNNRALVPDHPALMKRWRERAEVARGAHPPRRIAYGPGEREIMDLFEAAPGTPIAVFLHGGYWQALGREWFSGIAPSLLAHGVSLAIPSYDLAPDVRLGRILSQVREAVEVVRGLSPNRARPVVFGHSAGGHMAACMLSEGRASAAVAISGIFDLTPLIQTSVNDALGLDAREAAALSPIHWPVPNGSTPGGTVLDCVVGGEESAEFTRQSHMMADLWGGQGVGTRFESVEDTNHFTVLEPLFDSESAMTHRIAELASKA